MKKIKYFLSVALLIMAAALCAVSVSAYSEYDAGKKTALSITLSDGTNVVRGAEVSVYRVADLTIGYDDYSYTLLESYANFDLPIDDPQDRDVAEAMYDYTLKNNIKATFARFSDVHGYVYFGDLEQGLYLIAQTSEVKGFTAFSPFLTYLPITDESGWVYEVNATPKIDISSKPDEPDNPPPETTTTPEITTTPEPTTTPEVTTTVPSIITYPSTTTTVTTTTEETTEEETTEETTTEEEVTTEELPLITTTTRNPHDDDANAGAAFDPHGDDANAGVGKDRLVQTGQLNWPIPILGGLGLLFVGVGIVLRYTGRKNADDE